MKAANHRYLDSLCLIPTGPLYHLHLAIRIRGSGGHLLSFRWGLIVSAAVPVDRARIFNTLVTLTCQDSLLAVSCCGRKGTHGAHTCASRG